MGDAIQASSSRFKWLVAAGMSAMMLMVVTVAFGLVTQGSEPGAEPDGDAAPSGAPPDRVTPTALPTREWSEQADRACVMAIEEYQQGRTAAGGNDAPLEARAEIAAAAFTKAAYSIYELPEPDSPVGERLREAVTRLAGAYQELASDLQQGRYDELMKAEDAATAVVAAAKQAAVPACVAMAEVVPKDALRG